MSVWFDLVLFLKNKFKAPRFHFCKLSLKHTYYYYDILNESALINQQNTVCNVFHPPSLREETAPSMYRNTSVHSDRQSIRLNIGLNPYMNVLFNSSINIQLQI